MTEYAASAGVGTLFYVVEDGLKAFTCTLLL